MLKAILAEHEPLVLSAGAAKGEQQDAGREANAPSLGILLHRSPVLF